MHILFAIAHPLLLFHKRLCLVDFHSVLIDELSAEDEFSSNFYVNMTLFIKFKYEKRNSMEIVVLVLILRL
jgi:hypothetical protein